jgi:hypothetical protein
VRPHECGPTDKIVGDDIPLCIIGSKNAPRAADDVSSRHEKQAWFVILPAAAAVCERTAFFTWLILSKLALHYGARP